jgi:hypothetical protein
MLVLGFKIHKIHYIEMRAKNMAKNYIFHGKMLFNKSLENSHTGTSKYKSSYQF